MLTGGAFLSFALFLSLHKTAYQSQTLNAERRRLAPEFEPFDLPEHLPWQNALSVEWNLQVLPSALGIKGLIVYFTKAGCISQQLSKLNCIDCQHKHLRNLLPTGP
jgi:hypothetical protein